MAHYIDEREQRRLNRERLIEEAERQRRIEQDIQTIQHQREEFLASRARGRETALMANVREESQLLDYEDPYMTLDEYYLGDNPDRETDSSKEYRGDIQKGYEMDRTPTSQSRDVDREIVSDRRGMYSGTATRERDTSQRILSQLDTKESSERFVKEKEGIGEAVVRERGRKSFHEMQIGQSRDNEQKQRLLEQNVSDNREVDSSCARRYNRNYTERQDGSYRTPEYKDESLLAGSKKEDMLNVLDREIEDLDRRLSLMNSDTRSLLESSTDKIRKAKEKWDGECTELRTMPINIRQGMKSELEEQWSKDKRREEIYRRGIFAEDGKRIGEKVSRIKPDFVEYDRELSLEGRYGKPFDLERTERPSLTRRKLEFDDTLKDRMEGNKNIIPELRVEGHKGIDIDLNPAPLERKYISDYKPYSEVGKPYYPYGYVRKREFTDQSLPEVRQTDTRDRAVIERRMRKEQMLKAQEEELRRKELELQKREHWIKRQEQMEFERETSDPYEELLNEKEQKMKLKLEELVKKEKQLSERELKLQHNRSGRILVPQKVETESTEKGMDVSKQEDVRKTGTDAKGIGVTKQEDDIKKETDAKVVIKEDSKHTETVTTISRKDIETQTEEPTEEGTQTATELKTSIQDKHFYFPKFSVFSGEEPKPKTESSFDEWKYEVNCIRRDDTYKETEVAQAIRKSLKGQAKKVLLPMGTSASVSTIMDRLEGVFGNVATGESVLQEFYTATQKSDESVTAWGLRLEEILQKAVDKGHVRLDEKNDMLKTKFWRCLRSDRLKTATRIHYETMSSFELLRKKVRAEEYEMKVSSGVQHQPTRAESKCEDREESTPKMNILLDRLSALEKQMKEMKAPRKFVFNKRNYNQNTQPKTTEKPTETNTTPKQLN